MDIEIDEEALRRAGMRLVVAFGSAARGNGARR